MEIIKNKFRDKIFGDEVEYIVIKNKEERILIFQYNNKICNCLNHKCKQNAQILLLHCLL